MRGWEKLISLSSSRKLLVFLADYAVVVKLSRHSTTAKITRGVDFHPMIFTIGKHSATWPSPRIKARLSYNVRPSNIATAFQPRAASCNANTHPPTSGRRCVSRSRAFQA